MTSKLLLRVEREWSPCVSHELPPPAVLESMRKKMSIFAKEVQSQLGLPNNERFLLWHGSAAKYNKKYYIFIKAVLCKRQRKWIPEVIRSVYDAAIVGEEVHQVYSADTCCETKLVPYDDLVRWVVDQLK